MYFNLVHYDKLTDLLLSIVHGRGLAEYNPAIWELFKCPVQINVNLDLDYQAKRQWDFVSPKNGESLSSFFNDSFLPRVRAASECLQLIETTIDLGSVLHSAADKHKVSTPEVFVALQQTLVLKRSLLLILKNLFILGSSVIKLDIAKDLLCCISEPLQTLTAFDIDFDRMKEVKLKNFLYLDQKRLQEVTLMYGKTAKVLMWAAELWSLIHGIEDELTFTLGGDKDSGWTYDLHALVHMNETVDFQDNDFDCRIHVLDHLNRILQGKNLNRKDELTLKYCQQLFHLKQILLAHELYDDAKCPIV
ncbi:hypothetical protein BT96DRAFT_932331 [Gymnopus androsaceus JB14]|uniref:Uncharacterized protein n=1 Tax=Gymnopus androsaceus JB14 TaxID=1447944 RepID=A0A6A4IKR8_9AGAR|nr:hypothetical protein BT96DRAFT_932331 [Gymnopus androsaceus JB14]